MVGAIIQLVANSNAPQNIWLDSNPQITFFKKMYRRHTPFATELVPLSFKSSLNFGGSDSITILPCGDLAHRIFFVFDIPKLAAAFKNSKSEDFQKIINSGLITDQHILYMLKQYANNNIEIEFDRIFNLIDEILCNYDEEEQKRLNVLDLMEIYHDPHYMDTNELNMKLPLDTDYILHNNLKKKYQINMINLKWI